jgi:hypothetical protein
MFLHITSAEYVDEYKVKVYFNNGRTGIADLSSALKGPIFEPLKNKSLFSKLKVDKELGTIVWPNGVDLAPEFIYFLAFKDDEKLQPLFREWGYVAQQVSSSDCGSAALHRSG